MRKFVYRAIEGPIYVPGPLGPFSILSFNIRLETALSVADISIEFASLLRSNLQIDGRREEKVEVFE